MSFKENLKSELLYAGMMVKELSSITGIKRHTLDNYLNTHNSIPNAESAVKIAQALGITVEYLITGKNTASGHEQRRKVPNRDIQEINRRLENLTPLQHKAILRLLISFS